LGCRKCARKPERDNGEANGQSQKNHRFEGSLMDNRNHSVCQSCPGVQTCSFVVIIHLKKEGFSAGSGLLRPEVSSVGSVSLAALVSIKGSSSRISATQKLSRRGSGKRMWGCFGVRGLFPTHNPATRASVLYDFRVVWQSPRSCKLQNLTTLP
jgi:hypothetical protein